MLVVRRGRNCSPILCKLPENAELKDIQTCTPVEETSQPDLIDDQLLGNESELTPGMPHTLIVKGRKPAVSNR
jgi:hypothetical protein